MVDIVYYSSAVFPSKRGFTVHTELQKRARVMKHTVQRRTFKISHHNYTHGTCHKLKDMINVMRDA